MRDTQNLTGSACGESCCIDDRSSVLVSVGGNSSRSDYKVCIVSQSQLSNLLPILAVRSDESNSKGTWGKNRSDGNKPNDDRNDGRCRCLGPESNVDQSNEVSQYSSQRIDFLHTECPRPENAPLLLSKGCTCCYDEEHLDRESEGSTNIRHQSLG